MKTQALVASVLAIASFSLAMRADEPADCSVSVEVVNRLGVYRNFLNALEAQILTEKGFTVCQGDEVRRCRTEFNLSLLFRGGRESLTRNLTIRKNREILLNQDYLPNPTSVGALKILRTAPTCAELKALAER